MERIYQNLVKRGVKRPEDVPEIERTEDGKIVTHTTNGGATTADYEDALRRLGVDV